MSRLPLCVSFLLLAASAAAAAEPLPVHYWAGRTRIDTAVELDRVAAVGKARERTVTMVADAADVMALGRVKPAGAATTFAVLRGGTARDPLLLTRTLVIGLPIGADPQILAAAHGCAVVGEVDGLPGCILLAPKGGDLLAALNAANVLQESGAVRFAAPLIERQHQRRGDPPDPLFASQWHLKNTGPGQVPGGVAGADINVSAIWDFNLLAHLGTGINVAVVDDGMERSHQDLAANARLDLGRNFNGAPGGATDPSPSAADFHGTWCSGLIAARDSNGVGGVGSAPRASLVGVRLIAAATTEADDASALTYQQSDADPTRRVHVSSNSWGPDDRVVTDPTLANSVIGPLRLAALQSGTSTGRGGKGIVYVWAAGNGRQLRVDSDLGVNVGLDNLSYDGLASSRYVIAVGAMGPDGTQAAYSENGPALLVNAGGGAGAPAGIVTTDRTGAVSRPGEYTTQAQGISGTSFSTPIVSGVVALMLEANPQLTWRDVKHVLVRSAVRNDPGNADWRTNGAGRQHNVRYGFGRVDAAGAVTMAAPATWVLVPAEAAPLGKGESGLAVAIPDNNPGGIARTLAFSAGEVPSGFHSEYVELTVSATHTWRGDLRFKLTSPGGMVSDFEPRPLDSGADLNGWIFTSAAHWGEDPTGTWTLTVSDESAQDTGALSAWSLSIHGYLDHPTPVLTTLSPAGAATGTGATAVTISGTGFAAGVSQARLDGNPLATTVASATQLTATIPGTDLAANGVHTITVANPDFDGGPTHVSNGLTFRVSNPPGFSAPPSGNQAMTEDTPRAFTITLTDPDAGDTLTLSASAANAALFAASGMVVTGTGTTRTLTLTPLPDQNGSSLITLTVSDGATSATASFTAVVAAVNDQPVAFSGVFEARANQTLSATLSGVDPDVGQTLTAVRLVDSSDGTATVSANGAFTFQPTPGFTGITSFTWRLSDGTATADATATIVVMADPALPRPRITSEPADEVVLQGGGTWSYTPTVSHTSATTLQVTAPATVSGGNTILWPIAAPASGNHVSFVIIARDSLTGALDYQQVVLRYVPTGAPN